MDINGARVPGAAATGVLGGALTMAPDTGLRRTAQDGTSAVERRAR
ncbi:hypothetical protein OOK27_10590 [Streptomyces canus]|nr:hypothetical protein [Streptomyces canus]MCX5254625.1 hypothetical protein [Streptomyces canus]